MDFNHGMPVHHGYPPQMPGAGLGHGEQMIDTSMLQNPYSQPQHVRVCTFN